MDSPNAAEIFARSGITTHTLKLLSLYPQAGEPYGRRVLYQSAEYEVMLATWTPGAECAAHDHGFSNGLVWLAAGQFIENHYRFDGQLNLTESHRYNEASSIVSVNERDIHSMRAPSGGISLHVYSPPIHGMKVYDAVGQRTLVVSDDCGAWVPADQKLILDVRSWQQKPASLNT